MIRLKRAAGKVNLVGVRTDDESSVRLSPDLRSTTGWEPHRTPTILHSPTSKAVILSKVFTKWAAVTQIAAVMVLHVDFPIGLAWRSGLHITKARTLAINHQMLDLTWAGNRS